MINVSQTMSERSVAAPVLICKCLAAQGILGLAIDIVTNSC